MELILTRLQGLDELYHKGNREAHEQVCCIKPDAFPSPNADGSYYALVGEHPQVSREKRRKTIEEVYYKCRDI